MKQFASFTLVLFLAYWGQNWEEARAATNTLSGEVPMQSVRAPAFEQAVSVTRAAMIWTNGVPFDNGQPQMGSTSQEIQLTEAGCEAIWGRHKVLFDADIASQSPIQVTMPDGKRISFRPTFLVLANRASSEQLLIAEITNRIAQIIQPDRVVWTNAFDRSGPEIDIEYHYTSSGVEQNIVFRQNPLKNLPPGWKLGDVVIECWTEAFFDTTPATIESKIAEIRAESATEKVLRAEDQDISWDSMKIVSGGRAFSVVPTSKAVRSGSPAESDAEEDSLPVSKIWTEIDDGGRKRTFIIETLDALGAKPKLEALKEGRHASATRPASGRSEFLRLHASSAQIKRNALHASTLPSDGRTVASSERPSILVTLKEEVASPGFVLDFAIVNTISVPLGIISWWPAGGNALDAFTNHNDGYLSNGVTFVSGKVGQGFSFGAYSNYVKVPNSPSLNPTNALTIDCWVYLDKYGSNNMLVGKDNQVSQRQYALTVSPIKTFRACIGITNGTFYYIDSATLAATGVWTHIAMTYSAANSNLSFYLNGHLDTNATVVGSAISTTEPLFIGNAPRGSPYWWSYDPPGRIDEVDIFNRALSASDIQSIYDAGAAGKYNPNCVLPSTNIVAWWPAETNSYDIAGTNFAYPFNGPSYAAGAVRSAFSFDGINDYLVASNSPVLNPTNALTLEAWVYLNPGTPNSGNYPIISKDGCTINRQYLLTVSGNQKFRAHIGTSGCFCYGDGRTTVQSGGWYHVAMTYDTATSKLILYVNGAEDLTVTNIVGPAISTSEPVFIGGAPHSCFPYYWPGLIDEPTIYNRALSATEISAIYSAGSAGKCACYVTNQTFACISAASVSFGPVSLTNSTFCLGNSFSASISTTSLLGTVRQTLQFSDCNTMSNDLSFASTVTTNWWVLTAPDGSSVASNSLAVTFNPGLAGIWNLNFNLTYTNTYDPCTDPVMISLSTNIYVVDLADLQVSGYGPIFDDGVTRTYVICQDPLVTNVTVNAISNPNLAQSNLPPCWTLIGGTGTSQFTRTVNVSQVGTNVLSCITAYSHVTNIIIVASHADSDYDGLGDCEEIINGTNPNDPANTVQMRLGYWKFNDTNTWSGEQGQIPLISTNISGVGGWSDSAVEIASSSAALVYRTEESTGFANILCARGTVRFWFSPEWTSAAAGGSGPGIAGRFADVGHWTANGSYGWWSLATTPNGNSIQFVTQGDSATTTNLQAGISWTTGQWHQVAVTYTSTNTSIFVDGQPLNTNGLGITHYPNAAARASGFSIGATAFRTNQIKGLFDEFETFNYPLDPQSISNDFASGRPFLSPPIVTLDPTNDGTGLNLSISHLQAIELDSTCDTNSFPNPVQFLVETNYADSWFAREPLHFDSSSVGINITKLPAPVILPAGGNFNYPSNVTISLGSENLTNMVEGCYRAEFGRPSDPSGLSYWSAYAQNLRNLGYSDEQVRVSLLNTAFRTSSEYVTKYGAPGDTYVANTNYTIEFCTNTDGPWLTYTSAIQVVQSVTLYSRVSRATSTDNRTTYAYLTSDTKSVQFTVIPISWLTQNFGTNYSSNTNSLPFADPDHDGLANWQEFAFGTNPNDSDTDYDGRRDGDEIADGTDPLDPNSFLPVALAHWTFDGTNTWVGTQGQVPILASNVQAVASWSGSAAQVNSAFPATLAYACSDITNGPNINCRQGTIRFWFNPGWSSGGTNGGPGTQARLIQVGSETGTNGMFELFLSADGTSLTFVTGSFVSGSNAYWMTNFMVAPLNWVSNQWHQIALTYNETNSALYIDGLPPVTNGYAGFGVYFFPDAIARSPGFSIGSTIGGTNQARGQFDEIETFNYLLAGAEIASAYKTLTSGDSDGNGLPDVWERNNFGSVGVDPNADPDNDYLKNFQEYQAGTDPNKPDTDGDGRTDWQELMDGTDPLNPASKATWPVVADQPYTPTGSPPGLRTFNDSGKTYFVLETGDPNRWYDLYGTNDNPPTSNSTYYWMGRMRMNARYVLVGTGKTSYRLDTMETSANYHYDLLNRLQDKDSHPAYNYDNEGNIKSIAP